VIELSGEQQAAVAHQGSRLKIVACVGSGKTEVLARRAVP
jgi:superfamily I DNA/RNA helicase